jgi:uncharacterized protein YndB with AHSA1/START domain
MIQETRSVEALVHIKAIPSRVTAAFVEDEDLKNWWGVQRSLVEVRRGGVWALAWEISSSGIKYISTGIIHDFEPGEYLRIDNLVYLNPEKEILGPMSLEVFCDETKNDCKVRLKQSGYQLGGDWDWYYDSVVQAWPYALDLLKKYLEEV